MNRTARQLLVILGFQLYWPLALAQPLESPPQDPIAGARVLGEKGCAACHAVTRAGRPGLMPAPDLGHAASPRALSDVASAMWNHRPHVKHLLARNARLDAQETRNLLAFLYTLDYWDADGPEGDPQAGRRLFMDKQCVVCHQVAGTGGVIGPRLDSFRHSHSPLFLAASMWNHGPKMAEEMRARGIERPVFRGPELRHLVAYLKTASATEPGPLYLLLGDADRGRRVFTEKHCLECHGTSGLGPNLAGRATGPDLIDFATTMWNKIPQMTAMMKRHAIKPSPVSVDEMADLVAYLDSIGYFAHAGDARRGQKLADERGCGICHSASGQGVRVGKEPRGRQGPAVGPGVVISFAWNHSLLIEKVGGQATAAWRPLAAGEMVDLMAFVRSRGGEWAGGSSGTTRESPGALREPSGTIEAP